MKSIALPMCITAVAAALAGPVARADDVPAAAQETVVREMQQDVVLRAMVDELQRSFSELKLEGFDSPYFIEYGLTDLARAEATASLGALTSSSSSHDRSLYTDVRVGSYDLDNSNFSGSYGGYFGELEAAMPLEDDYTGIRQAFWWTSDRDYKSMVETLAQKKAFMETKLITDKPPDFSREAPAVYFEPRLQPDADQTQLEELVTALSAVFREVPEVQRSIVSVSAWVANKYVVNTEGTRLRTAVPRYTLAISALVQADDGMRLGDSITLYTRSFAELPARDELLQRCRALAQQLVALKQAPVLDTYTGPVLFEAKAAAELFGGYFGGNFAGGQRPLGSRTSPDDFANKLNKRILPRFLNAVDDPTLAQVGGVPALGHYVYDDQGVKAQPVKLIEGGKLTNLLMSRLPSKEFRQSNGHGRGSYGGARAAVGCLLVTADPGLDATSLRQELLDACADEGLEFGLRITALGGLGDSTLRMYKVFADGREQLVRGAEIARIDLKAFKRMLAAGDTPYVHNVGGLDGQTVAVPAMLFEELDVAKIDREFDKPPILPNPLVRKTTEE